MPAAATKSLIQDTISPTAAQKYYDLWGRHYDWFSFFESRAKSRSLELLDLQPGLSLLHVGLGTGKEHEWIVTHIEPDGRAYGLDLSLMMLQVARARLDSPLCQADGGYLPFGHRRFDRLYAAYVIDLIPTSLIPVWLQGFRRVLKPGGCMVLLTLTEGVTVTSRAVVSLWKAAYRLYPLACGGCRPLQLTDLMQQAGFQFMQDEIIIQFGIPSQVILAYP